MDTEADRQREVDDLMSETTKLVNKDDSSDADEEEDERTRNQRKLDRCVQTQKQLYRVGKVVGEKGKPSQIVQDAHLSSRANTQTIPAIRGIRISRSVWHSKIFTHKLLAQLTKLCGQPEEYQDQASQNFPAMAADADTDTDKAYFQTFIEEYCGECLAGLVPSLNTVYGAVSTGPTVRKKPVKTSQTDTQASQASQASQIGRARQTDRELPQSVKRLQAADMDANVDPTMKRVKELRDLIRRMYCESKKPVDLMHVLTDRVSFPTTVQNFFCFSFLLKESEVRMYLDECGLPVCTPVRIPKGGDPPGGSSLNEEEEGEEDEDVEMEDVPDPTVNRAEEDKFQTIMMSLTEAEWKDLVATFYPEKAPASVGGATSAD